MDVTKELQEELITGLLKDSHFFSETKDEIDDSYFRDGACKVIYKALSVYYKKYNSIPTLNEMLITIDDCYSLTAGVTLAEVKDTVCRLYEMPKADEAFLYDKMTSFIYNIRLMQGLPKVITEFKNNSNDIGIVAQVLKSLDINFNTSNLFTMNDVNQVKEARLSAIGSEDQSKIIKSFIPTVNNCLMFGGWQPGTVNMIVAPPGTGKSMFLINEGVSAAKQGFDVLHIFIGDMVNYDGYIRYLSCMSNTNQGSLIGISLDKQQEIVKFCNQQYNNITDRIAILSYPSLSLTINSLMENINRLEAKNKKDFDMIIIDYPDNLLQEGKSLYEDGGTLYSSLERLARLTKSVVLVASQPSKIYWNYSIIPLEGASESSKKQQCVDVMLTFNTETRGAKIGSLHLVKARKGEEGSIIRIKTDYARCHMEEIDEAEFNILKDQLKLNPVGPKNNV